jgi:hypothetical protein
VALPFEDISCWSTAILAEQLIIEGHYCPVTRTVVVFGSTVLEKHSDF